MSALKYMLPATPSWYYSRVMDSSIDGLICFGSRSSVNVWDLRHSNLRLYPFPVAHHNDKVAGVSFASADGRDDGDERAVVSASGDKLFVTRFNLKTFKCTTESENDSHRNKITVVQWSPLNENMIVSGDDKGSVCFWDMSKDVKVWHTCQHSDNYINSLSVSTSKHNEVAVGLKVGIILILELVDKKVEVLYKLRGHEENVQSLHWLRCYQDLDKDDVVSRLVSVCRDKTLKLWTLRKQRQNNWDVSTVSLFKKNSERWFSLSSIPGSDSQMIVSSANELYTINLTAEKLKLQPLVRNLKGHSLVIFNVVSWRRRRRSGSMGEGFDDVMVCSHSMDRQLIVWNVKENQVERTLPTIGGFVYSINQSPIEPGLFALGVGDNTIQTMTLNNGKCTNNRTFWQFMKSKVTAVRWHPTSDNLLAFGTEDGMVGLVNTAANAKTPVTFSRTHHNNLVRWLTWGPLFTPRNVKINNNNNQSQNDCDGGDVLSSADEHAIFSVGDHHIHQHSLPLGQEEAVDIDVIIGDHRSAGGCHGEGDVVGAGGKGTKTKISFTQDFKYFALGYISGVIEVYDCRCPLNPPTLICSIHHCKKPVADLSWHPDVMMTSSLTSRMRHHLAVCASVSDVCVYNLKNVIDGWTSSRTEERTVTKIQDCFMTLKGHTRKIRLLAWSPHREGQLVTTSFDKTVQIWDMLKSNKSVEMFKGHRGHVSSVEWGLEDEGLVFSGGEDFTLQGWMIDKLPQHVYVKKEFSSRYNRKETCEALRKEGPDVSSTEDTTKDTLIKNFDLNDDADHTGNVHSSSSKDLTYAKSTTSATVATVATASATPSIRDVDVGVLNKDVSDVIVHDVGDDDDDEDGDDVNKASLDRQSQENLPSASAYQLPNKKSYKKKVRSILPNWGTHEHQSRLIQGECVKLARTRAAKKQITAFTSYDYEDCDGKMEDYYDDDYYEDYDDDYEDGDEDDGSGGGGKDDDDVSSSLYFDCYINRRSMCKLLDNEIEQHILYNNEEGRTTLEIYAGRGGAYFREMMRKGELNDHMLATAAMVSKELWAELCLSYAHQLKREGQIHKATTYLLAIDRVEEALELLLDNKLYKDALCLARLRLPSCDPLLQLVFNKSAEAADKIGYFEMAAKCYLATNNDAKALEEILRRKDPQTSRVSALVAQATNNAEVSRSSAESYVIERLLNCDWSSVDAFLNEIEEFQHLRLLSICHECVTRRLKYILPASINTSINMSINLNSGRSFPPDETNHTETPNESFLDDVLHRLKTSSDINLDDGSRWGELQSDLMHTYKSRQFGTALQQIVIEISLIFSVAFAKYTSCLLGENSHAFTSTTTDNNNNNNDNDDVRNFNTNIKIIGDNMYNNVNKHDNDKNDGDKNADDGGGGGDRVGGLKSMVSHGSNDNVNSDCSNVTSSDLDMVVIFVCLYISQGSHDVEALIQFAYGSFCRHESHHQSLQLHEFVESFNEIMKLGSKHLDGMNEVDDGEDSDAVGMSLEECINITFIRNIVESFSKILNDISAKPSADKTGKVFKTLSRQVLNKKAAKMEYLAKKIARINECCKELIAQNSSSRQDSFKKEVENVSPGGLHAWSLVPTNDDASRSSEGINSWKKSGEDDDDDDITKFEEVIKSLRRKMIDDELESAPNVVNLAGELEKCNAQLSEFSDLYNNLPRYDELVVLLLKFFRAVSSTCQINLTDFENHLKNWIYKRVCNSC